MPKKLVEDANFKEEVYADDLNAYKEFPTTVKNEAVLQEGYNCQTKLHRWGAANQVTFDPAKESFHVLAQAGGEGGNTELLGVIFDTGLRMEDAVHDTVVEVGCKLRTLQRSTRFHTDAELVLLYKTTSTSFGVSSTSFFRTFLVHLRTLTNGLILEAKLMQR